MFSATDFFENPVKSMNHLPREKQNQTTDNPHICIHCFANGISGLLGPWKSSLGSPDPQTQSPEPRTKLENEEKKHLTPQMSVIYFLV